MKSVLNWAPVALGTLFLVAMVSLQADRVLTGTNDFVAFYTGAKLVGTADLYSPEANIRVIQETLGVHMVHTLYIRHPFYAALWAPVAALPYKAAYAIFSTLTVGAFLWFVARFRKECPSLPLFASLSMPLALAVSNGQDPQFLVAAVGASILLTRSGRDLAAGLVLSLCLLKPHLFLFVAVLLLLKKRWRIIQGGLLGTAALTLFGVAVNGIESIPQWLGVLQNPWINGETNSMPNLPGLVSALGAPSWMNGVLLLLAAGVFLWLVQRSDSYEFLLAAALICGLLANFHAATSDDLLLVPVLILVTASTDWVPLRIFSALILTPVPYFVALAGPPYSAALPALLLVQLLLFCGALARRPESVSVAPAPSI